MYASDFTYAGQDVQIRYSEARSALGEYVYIPSNPGRWAFAGWLWEGQIHNRAEAEARTAEYVNALHPSN